MKIINKQQRRKLKTYYSLLDQKSINQLYPPDLKKQLQNYRTIRILHSIQLNHLFLTYLQLLQSQNINPKMIKIGLIGCGNMGRILMNNLLVLCKENFSCNNITISTRRPQIYAMYQSIGISIFFDNQRVIEQNDIIIITFPDTLDNWTYTDLQESVQNRMNRKNSLKPLIVFFSQKLNVQRMQDLLKAKNIFYKPSINLKYLQHCPQFFSQDILSQKNQILEEFAYRHFIPSFRNFLNCLNYIFFHKQISGSFKQPLQGDKQTEGEQQLNGQVMQVLYQNKKWASYFVNKSRMWRSAYYNFIK